MNDLKKIYCLQEQELNRLREELELNKTESDKTKNSE